MFVYFDIFHHKVVFCIFPPMGVCLTAATLNWPHSKTFGQEFKDPGGFDIWGGVLHVVVTFLNIFVRTDNIFEVTTFTPPK